MNSRVHYNCVGGVLFGVWLGWMDWGIDFCCSSFSGQGNGDERRGGWGATMRIYVDK